MKRIFLLFLLINGTFLSVIGQSYISFGLKTSPSINWKTFSDTSLAYDYKIDSKLAFSIGPSIRYIISENFNIDFNLLFGSSNFVINQTNNSQYSSTEVDIDEDIKLNQIIIPINFNGQFNLVNKLQGVMNFGTSLYLKTSGKRTITDKISNSIINDFTNVKNIKFYDIALSIGAGLDYHIANNLHLTFTTQYSNGIIDIWNDGNISPSKITNLELKDKNVNFLIGFYIDFH